MVLSPGLRRWLTDDADPVVRRRVLTELLRLPDDDPRVRAAGRAMAREGWAARTLDEQFPDGQWATRGTSGAELYRPKYIATNWRLILLSDWGVDPTDARVRRSVDLFLRRFGRSGDLGGPRSEVCFTGNAVRLLVRLGRGDAPEVGRALRWLVRAQKADGGWHCFRSRTGTLDGWEAMAAFAALPARLRTPEIDRAIVRGADFYLDRSLTREGRRPYAPWLRLHYPVHYYYDLLVGLDFLTALGYGDDPRLRPALRRLEAKRRPDGRWNLDAHHPDVDDPAYPMHGPIYPIALESAGEPSRWITTTALIVLDRAGRR